MLNASDLNRIQLLLDALFLGPVTNYGQEDLGVLESTPSDWVVQWLGLDPRQHFGIPMLRHLVAIQLAPREAIAYATSNPVPRWKLIGQYLQEQFTIGTMECERVARIVAYTLDTADTERGQLELSVDSAMDCAICHLSFLQTPESVNLRDSLKPIWRAPVELTRPEVDHIIPVSSLGSDEFENLQVICRACNMAKGSGLTIDPSAEIAWSAADSDSIPRIHLFRILQWLIQYGGNGCSSCGKSDSELTMVRKHVNSPIVRSALVVSCYGCRPI